MRTGDESRGVLPNARGLAIFARAVDVDNDQIGKIGIERLVIGSPLYVEQV